MDLAACSPARNAVNAPWFVPWRPSAFARVMARIASSANSAKLSEPAGERVVVHIGRLVSVSWPAPGAGNGLAVHDDGALDAVARVAVRVKCGRVDGDDLDRVARLRERLTRIPHVIARCGAHHREVVVA